MLNPEIFEKLDIIKKNQEEIIIHLVDKVILSGDFCQLPNKK